MRKEIKAARFFNCGGGQAIAIIAVANHHEGEMIDWAAYIGIGPVTTESECIDVVVTHGCKLSCADAQHFFPELPPSKWRR